LTLTSQDRHWKEIQQTFKAEVIAPLQCETNPQDEQDPKVYPPPRSAMDMFRTKDDTTRNQWIRAFKKEFKTIIDDDTLDLKTPPEDGEPTIVPIEANQIKSN
jgi:hypothetical protein